MKENALKWLGLGGKGGPKWPELGWWDVEEATKKGGAGATPHLAALNAASLDTLTTGSSSDLAFLQYTSGSTSEPKGVRITHANLAHNLHTIVTSLAAGSDTVVASWLPQYHDMGLIGSYLGVMACGGSGVYMSPLSFLKAPLAWIAMMSKYKATHIQAPNFAYSLVARRWRELPTSERSKLSLNTNLSSIRHAFNAAESVTTHSCAEFFAAFVPCGLSPRAMSPGFGLAENTVYVSDGGRNVVWVDREILEEEGKAHVLATVPLTSLLNPEAIAAIESTQAVGGGVPDSSSTSLGRTTNQGGKQSRRIGSYVACGPVATPPGLTPMASIGTTTSSVLGAKNRDVWVLVVNPTTHLPAPQEGTVGEVWVHSPSTADGYEGKEEATQEAFKAHLAENSFSFFPPPSAPTPTPRISPITAAVAGLSSITLPGRAPPLPPAAAPAMMSPVSALLPGPPPSTPSSNPPLPGMDAPNPLRVQWLRTGDLGFIWGGELFICSRMKDLIILRGRNFYPHDIEEALEDIPSSPAPNSPSFLRPGATAAFSLPMTDIVGSCGGTAPPKSGGSAASSDSHEDGLVVVGEVRDGVVEALFPSLVSELKAVCMRDFGIRPHAVLLLKARGTRKTTSGKVARKHNATAYASRLRGGAVGEKNPWGVGNSVVLYEWKGSDGVAVGGGVPSTRVEPSTPVKTPAPGTVIVASTPTASAAAPPPPPQTPSRAARNFTSLTGDALSAQLLRDVGDMMNETNLPSISTTRSLFELGMDSLTLAQIPPRFKAEYGFNIGDPQVFSDGFTLTWLVTNADELRKGPVELPLSVMAASSSSDAPAGTEQQAQETSTSGVEATSSGILSPVSNALPSGGRTPTSRRRNEPSAVEANCPCCLMCF